MMTRQQQQWHQHQAAMDLFLIKNNHHIAPITTPPHNAARRSIEE
jgi:hypothetical protein